MSPEHHDLVGIGVGPFNLSLAALLEAVPTLRAVFLERRQAFRWHPGMMLPDARMQTSWLKDLVTPVHPTSPYSFAAYLVAKRRFYAFISAGFEAVSRAEFADYLGWAAAQLPSLRFGERVHEVDFDGRRFVLRADGGSLHADNLVLATGHRTNIPACLSGLLGPDCLHASAFLDRRPDLEGRRVAIIGGGQSGAELFLHALRGHSGRPAEVAWLSRRANFEPLDETPFTNELFTPDYVRRFYALPAARKAETVAAQKLASDGISPLTLREIYRHLYDLAHVAGTPQRFTLLPGRELFAAERRGNVFSIVLRNRLSGAVETRLADCLILCTGYRFAMPACLEPLRPRLDLCADGQFTLGPDFALSWDGPAERRIFAQNAGRHSHGIAEPQMSLMAWRSATIVNALLGRAHFDVGGDLPLIDWTGGGTGSGHMLPAAQAAR